MVLEGKKVNNITSSGAHNRVESFMDHYPTELEAVYITGNFKVTGDTATGLYIDAVNSENHSNNLVQSGYPFYAGKAIFTQSFRLDKIPQNNCLNQGVLCAH